MAAYAQVHLSVQDDGMTHVSCKADGDSVDEVKALATKVLAGFARYKEAYVRTEPWAETEKDFPSSTVTNRGGVRFSFVDKPGEWHLPATQEPIESVGFS